MSIAVDGSLYRALADGSPDLHTVTTPEGVFRFVSRNSLALFGWQQADLIGQHEATFIHLDDVGLVDEALRMSEDPTLPVMTVRRFRCADGTYLWTETLSRRVDALTEQVIVSAVRNIGARRESDLALHRQATTDPLTGVANRTVLMDRLNQALRRLERGGGFVAILFLDLDRFKLINDTIGHHMGDAVLLQMAERLRCFLRPEDTLARMGGDEFAVVIEEVPSAEEVVALAARIVAAGRTPFALGDEQVTCTTSVGIAMTRHADHGAEVLLQEADLALYRAKDRGRDRADVFDEDLRTRATNRLGTERMLRRAIDEQRLRLHFQPIVDLRTSTTVAAEALVRVWDADAAELLSAHGFIDVAEEAGLLVAIDQWVLGESIAQATRWHSLFADTGFTEVAINVTARHLADPSFAQSVIDDLARHDLPTACLQIELTERVLMEASNSAMAGLRLLRHAGVKVGLDDFGTGYSSLSYLQRFPVDFVKIDQSFVRELAVGATEAIVASIIDLSHALGMDVVAEGVETLAQLDQLLGLGCDRAQGFLFASAGPPEVIEDRVLRPSSQLQSGVV